MAGFDGIPKMAPIGGGGIGFPRGHILHDYIEARLMPSIVGPVGRGTMQYAEMWKAAQRMTTKPVKFGTVTPELVAFAVQDFYYKDVRERIWAISDAFNEELHALADAGRRRTGRVPGGGAAQGRDCAGLADGAGPGRGVDAGRAGVRR